MKVITFFLATCFLVLLLITGIAHDGFRWWMLGVPVAQAILSATYAYVSHRGMVRTDGRLCGEVFFEDISPLIGCRRFVYAALVISGIGVAFSAIARHFIRPDHFGLVGAALGLLVSIEMFFLIMSILTLQDKHGMLNAFYWEEADVESCASNIDWGSDGEPDVLKWFRQGKQVVLVCKWVKSKRDVYRYLTASHKSFANGDMEKLSVEWDIAMSRFKVSNGQVSVHFD